MVSILLVMDDGLGDFRTGLPDLEVQVSILLVMDDGLGATAQTHQASAMKKSQSFL